MSELPERIGHYKILSLVGEGGMGVVYKAQDEHLNRIVALKVIREFQSDASRRQRFWQEARAAAQITHPNACRIYDIAEEKNCLFFVMELIDGESLSSRLQSGPLPAQEAAQIVLNILSALEAFHKAGLVHRDLKPSNVMLSAQGTKLLDFGLAKYVSPDSSDSCEKTYTEITKSGVFLGTPRYASPEQYFGKPVDARSDLFSVGAILYEMLTGKQPFSGACFAELSHAVLHESPPPLGGSPAIEAMSRIVHTALAKDPQERYASAEAMAAELRRALIAEGMETKVRALALRRLIVLPFRLLRPDSEVNFLAYSLPEALTVSLAGLADLVVRSSIVAARYAQDPPDLARIAGETEVDVVLTGTLLKVGERLRITTQLVEAPTGTLVWAQSSQATIGELLELHDDLVHRVVESLAPSLSPRERGSLQKDRPASPAVYELYLRANELSRQWENLTSAIEVYEKCVGADPSYAPAWARLGRARWLWDKYNLGSEQGLRHADAAFQKALELNPNLTLAHNLYTNLQVDQGRALQAMNRLLDRARRRRNDPDLFAGLAHACRYCGLLVASLAADQEARRLDPQISTSVANAYFMMGNYQRALETSGSDFGYLIALTLASLGRVKEAVSLLREREQIKPWRLGRLHLTSLRALFEENRAESLAASEELMKATFRDPEGMYYLARQLGYLGEHAAALDMLRRAVDGGFFCYPYMVRDPWLDSLRGRSDFTSLLRKAQELHREAVKSFVSAKGDALLGIQAENYERLL